MPIGSGALDQVFNQPLPFVGGMVRQEGSSLGDAGDASGEIQKNPPEKFCIIGQRRLWTELGFREDLINLLRERRFSERSTRRNPAETQEENQKAGAVRTHHADTGRQGAGGK